MHKINKTSYLKNITFQSINVWINFNNNKKIYYRIKNVKNNFIDLIDSINKFIIKFQQQQKRLFNLFNSHTSKLSIIQLNNNVVERFKKINIKYFDFTCSKSHNKNDYIIINDKIYYRNV